MDKYVCPLISVIITVYNVELYLKQCIESVINQTYKNIEMILVDDGSTDNSSQICDSYAKNDVRIHVIHKTNGGLVNARKTGVLKAKGTYVTYVDGDDWIDEDTYEKLILECKGKEPDVIAYGMTEEYSDRSSVVLNSISCGYYENDKIKEEIYPNILCNGVFFQPGILPNVCAKLMKLEILLESQLNVTEGIEIGEDAVCTFKTCLNSQSIMILKLAPYHYRKRVGSMMGKEPSFDQCRLLFNDLQTAILEKEYGERLLPQLYRYIVFILLLKKYDLFLDKGLSNFIFKDLGSSKIALYGAGGFGQEVYYKTKKVFPDRICVWIDKRHSVYSSQGMPVESVEQLLKQEDDIVLIAVLNTNVCQQIKYDLVAMGISSHKIKFVSILDENFKKIVDKIFRG